jgi:hypothetical protein
MLMFLFAVNREWDYDYDDVRNKLGVLESVVSEVNKVISGAGKPFRTSNARNSLRKVHQPQDDPRLYSL